MPAEFICKKNSLIVIKDLHPKASIHYLIIPKKHIADIQGLHAEDASLITDLIMEAQELAKTIPGAESFNLVVNNGATAGQCVFHLHIHFVAGKKLFKPLTSV